MSKLTDEAIRMTDREEKNYFTDWNELCYYFPEIRKIRHGHELLGVQLPKTAFNSTFIKVNNDVYFLSFEIERSEEEISSGKSSARIIKYESPLATQSILLDLIRN